jgi:cobalt-zinc-cadmium efflux system membrane fusion protein
VAYNAFETTPVFAAIGGPVHEILVAPGQFAQAGQPLLTVTSPDYSVARSAYIKAQDAFALTEKLYTRAQDLYAHGAIAEADLQQAESNHIQAHADMESSADALRALGVKDPEALIKKTVPSTAEVPVLAPVTGEIVERLVGPGQLLQSGVTQCFTISNTNTVWVVVNVYQNDLPYVHIGDAVEVNTDSYPELFHGKISYIAPALDPNTRTLQARIVTQNPGKKLKKDMYVTALVKAGSIPDAITVADAAILRDTENQTFVYVQVNANQFARRVVTIGQTNQGRTQVTSGLKEGEHDFLAKAATIRRYGAAVVVMCFDETGQADSVDRKVAIAERSFRLLVDRACQGAHGVAGEIQPADIADGRYLVDIREGEADLHVRTGVLRLRHRAHRW